MKGKIVPIANPQDWLDQGAALLRDAQKLERSGGSNEGIFRNAYPSAELVVKAARCEHETGRKGHHLARPLGMLAQGRFGEEYLRLPGVAGNANKLGTLITPDLLTLAKEVEAFWPPYMDATHGPITKDAKDKTLRLAELVNRVLQPRSRAKEAKINA